VAHLAHAAGRGEHGEPQRFAGRLAVAGRGEPAEGVVGERFAATPVALAPHHDGVELAGVEGIDEIAGQADAHVEPQRAVETGDARQQRRQVGTGDMIAETDGQPPHRRVACAQGAVMRREQIACPRQKGGAVLGQPHRARRAFDEFEAEPVLEPLQLQADRRLRHADGLRGAGEARQIGDQREGADGVNIEGGGMICHCYHCYR